MDSVGQLIHQRKIIITAIVLVLFTGLERRICWIARLSAIDCKQEKKIRRYIMSIYRHYIRKQEFDSSSIWLTETNQLTIGNGSYWLFTGPSVRGPVFNQIEEHSLVGTIGLFIYNN
jgi:hypothetical protein